MQVHSSSNSVELDHSPTILLRSSWQTVNIGDIGHTPGMVALLKKHIPEATIILWPNKMESTVRDSLLKAFPDLEILDPPSDWANDDEWLDTLFARADLLLHSSGPHMVGLLSMQMWTRKTDKPYGVYGVTLDPLSKPTEDPDVPSEGGSLAEQWEEIGKLPPNKMTTALRESIEKADFMFCRDTMTLEYVRRQCPAARGLGFAPDAAFGIEVRDDERAEAFLATHGLEKGNYICVIPRLRYTPYHLIHGKPATKRDLLRVEISDRHREKDMKKLRDFITSWVRETGVKVVLCPEMTYQIEVGKEFVYDQLPEDVRELVVWRSDYWYPGEACSTYAFSHSVISMDNHSPIFALAMGIPTVFMRHATDTIKGQMWPDIEMGDWFMETDEIEGKDVFERAMEIYNDREAAVRRVEEIMTRVRWHQEKTLGVVRKLLETSPVTKV